MRSILSVSALSLLGLTLALVGCDGNTACSDDCDNSEAVRGEDDPVTGCNDDCDTDDTSSEAKAELIVNSTFQNVVESGEVVVDEKTVGNTGETIFITPDVAIEVEVGILDGPRTTDNLPLHTLGPSWDETVWAGASVVTPKVPVTGDLTTPQTVNAGFNLWRPDEYWTCDKVRSWDGDGNSDTWMSGYTNGNTFRLPFGEVAVDGISFQLDTTFTGEFTSPITASATWVQDDVGDYYITYTCYKSDINGNKVDADGNPVSE